MNWQLYGWRTPPGAQVLRVVAGESLLGVAIGVVLGVPVTAVNLAGLGAALARLSAPVTVAVPWQSLGATASACAVIAVTASLLPPYERCAGSLTGRHYAL